VDKNGKKEESSGYTSDSTEDREPACTSPFPDSSKPVWMSVFYSSGTVNAPESSMKRYSLSMGWLKSEIWAVPYFISYSRGKG